MCLRHRLMCHISTHRLTVNYFFIWSSVHLTTKNPPNLLGLEGHHMLGRINLLCVVTLR